MYALSELCGKKVYFIQGFENWSFPDEEVYNSYCFGMANIVIAKWLKEIVEEKAGKEAFYVSNGINEHVFLNQIIWKRKPHTIAFHYRSERIKGAIYSIEVVKKKKINIVIQRSLLLGVRIVQMNYYIGVVI